MSKFLVAHVAEDTASAIGIAAILPSAAPWLMASAPDPRTPLLLCWSASATKQAGRIAEIALTHRAPLILCLLDAAELPRELARLNIAAFDGGLSGRAFVRAAQAAFIEARRIGPVRPKSRQAQETHASVVGGVIGGLAGGVAVLGLGSVAAAALGLVPAPEGTEEATPLSFLRIASADAPVSESYNGLPSDDRLRGIVAKMQQRHQIESGAVTETLTQIEQDFAAHEADMSRRIDELNALSNPHSWRRAPALPSAPVRALAAQAGDELPLRPRLQTADAPSETDGGAG